MNAQPQLPAHGRVHPTDHTGHAPSTNRRVGRLLVIGLFATAALLLVAAPAGAATLQGGATLANQDTSVNDSGAAGDHFTFQLPAQAACPGDSVSGGYQVYGYLEPQGTDLTSLAWPGGAISKGQPLLNGGAVWHANTAPTSGQVINIPLTFTFLNQTTRSHPTQATLLASPGIWEVGVACANSSGAITNYWNAEITFTSDGSGSYNWTDVPGAPTPPANTPEVPVAILLPLLAAVIAGFVVIRNRRNRSTPQPTAG